MEIVMSARWYEYTKYAPKSGVEALIHNNGK